MKTNRFFIQMLVYLGMLITLESIGLSATWYAGCSGHAGNPSYKETIQQALSAAATDDTVLVCDGTYTEDLSISSKNNITLGSESADKTRVTIYGTTSNNVLKIESANNVTVENLTLSLSSAGNVRIINALNADNLILNNLTVNYSGGSNEAIKIDSSLTPTLSSLTVTSDLKGITLTDSGDFTATECNVTVTGSGTDSWAFKADPSGTFVMTGNTINATAASSSGVLLKNVARAFTFGDNNVTVTASNGNNVYGVSIEGAGASIETGGNDANISGNIISIPSGSAVQSALNLTNVYNTTPTNNCFLGGYGYNTTPYNPQAAHVPTGECTVSTANNLSFFGNFWGNSDSVLVDPDCPDSFTKGSCGAALAGQTEPSVYAGFNIVYADYANDALASNYYYNLPTQIASRADNYKVISQVGYGANSNALTDINATVKIELVDADTSETCSAMTPISDHTWITFDNSGITDLYAANIITGSIIYDTNASRQFFKKAAKNVKFRISYSRADTDGLITFTKDDNGKYHLENFPAYAGSTCVSAFDATEFNNDGTPKPTLKHHTQVSEACANNGNGNGNSGMTQHELDVCMECLYGTNVTYTCSQDNFSIRPEGFLVKINDQNQTTGGSKSTIALNTNPTAMNLASGYLYSTEINATNHIDSFPPTDYNTSSAMFSWRWTPGTVNVSGCNDTSDKNTTLTFSAGMTDTNISVAQVGNYQLDVIDSSWTAVDRSPSGHTSPYYVTTADADCVVGSNATSAVKTSDIGINPSINGCNIGSDHTNSVEGVTYYDNNATFHPYTIDISTMAFSKGTTPTPITSGSNAFVYTSDLSRDDSMNMSLRASGNIKALSYSNTVLSNFVADCYAKDLNLTLHSSNNLTLDNGTYQIRFMDYNSSGSLIYDSNATNVTTTNLSIPLFQISDGNFTKDTNGSLSTLSRINYDHNHTRPTNPITAQLHHLSIQCSTPSECQMYADGISSHEANSTASMDMNITYAYGRVIPRDVRVFGSSSFTANAWYEVYNASSLLGTTLQPSRNTSLWYINAEHNVSNDGNASVSVILPSLNLSSTSNSAGVETYTFAGTNPVYSGIAHINTDPWLWYGANASEYADPINATNLDCLTHPCFNINIVPNMGRAGSATSESLRNTKSNKSTTTNGVTYDYSPSTR